MTKAASFAWVKGLSHGCFVWAGIALAHAGPLPEPDAAPSTDPAFSTLWAFKQQIKELHPQGGVAVDSAGNVYGTRVAILPCSSDCGEIFRLGKPTKGRWAYESIHKFNAHESAPFPSLTSDGSTIYGVTASDGAAKNVGGTLFRLTPSDSGWVFKVLHRFDPTTIAGADPLAGVTIDTDGTLYGVAQGGPGTEPPCQGIVYKFTLPRRYEILHDFSNNSGDVSNGCVPGGELIFGKDGALYGTTTSGGTSNHGTVFRLTKTKHFSVIQSFVDGIHPSQRLALGPDGTLYGTTQAGGAHSHGTAWSLQPKPRGAWSFTEIFDFPQGGGSVYGIARDQSGNLYGTIGGSSSFSANFPEGVLYRLSPPASGSTWSFTTLHEFSSVDGALPVAGPTLNGNELFGPTYQGGNRNGTCANFGGCGTVYGYQLP